MVEAWQFERRVGRVIAERIAAERLDDPDTQVVVLSAGRGWMRVEVCSGPEPRVGSLLCVSERGVFEVTHVDVLPAPADESRFVAMLAHLPLDADTLTSS